VEAWQHVKPSRTNGPCGLTGFSFFSCRQWTGTTPKWADVGGNGKGVGWSGDRETGNRKPDDVPTHPSADRPVRDTAGTLEGPLSLDPGLVWIDVGRRIEEAGGHSAGDTPVPFPNTAVKPRCADGTAGEARWESTTLPAPIPHDPPVRLPWSPTGGSLRWELPKRPFPPLRAGFPPPDPCERGGTSPPCFT